MVPGEVFYPAIVTKNEDADPESFRALDPGWKPTLSAAAGGFGLADLLTIGER